MARRPNCDPAYYRVQVEAAYDSVNCHKFPITVPGYGTALVAAPIGAVYQSPIVAWARLSGLEQLRFKEIRVGGEQGT